MTLCINMIFENKMKYGFHPINDFAFLQQRFESISVIFISAKVSDSSFNILLCNWLHLLKYPGISWGVTHKWYMCVNWTVSLHVTYMCDIISYPLFADAGTGIYPHPASQYHARLKAKRGIAMLSVDKFPYPRKQTRGNEFIPCSNNIFDILKRFRSFKIPAIISIWPKSLYKHSVTRLYRSGKERGRRSESPLWRHQWRSFVFISHADAIKREIRLRISRLLTNQKRESARSMGYYIIHNDSGNILKFHK